MAQNYKKNGISQKKICNSDKNAYFCKSIQQWIMKAKPFIKWVGGKGQLIEQIDAMLPANFGHWEDVTYIEPFVGGGALLFYMLQRYPHIRHAVINDINTDLTTCYRIVRDKPKELIKSLHGIEGAYINLKDKDSKQEFFMQKRARYNTKNIDDVENTTLFIFLNRTCFNGLYRVNSEGYFNTPMGRNNIVNFYDRKNILSVSKYLNSIPEENIMCGSYKQAMARATMGDIVYVDPPYDYVENDGFTKYQKEGFYYEDLVELKSECDKCIEREATVIISNNDTDKVRKVFENDTKHDYSFYFIEKINTKRLINCKANLRNTGKEIIIWGVPLTFPNIYEIDLLLKYIRLKNTNKLKNSEELAKSFRVGESRVNKYVSTLRYFGIINSKKQLTEIGTKINKATKKEAPRILRNCILENSLFNDVFEHDVQNTSEKYNVEEITLLLLKKQAIKEGIASKRAFIIRKIVDWCLAN